MDGHLASTRLWPFLADLANELPGAWTLVGGQMVLLLGLEHEQLPRRETTDVDALVNVRVVPRGTERFTRALESRGLSITGMSPEGIGHRLSGAGFTVDVLAPDNLGARANLTTVRPARTVEIPGGTRLARSPRRCPVAVSGTVHHVPRPDLDAAIVGKAAAVGLPGDARRHAEDLAFLCGLVEDPRPVASVLSSSDRRHLERARALLDEGRVWAYASDANAAKATFRYLLR